MEKIYLRYDNKDVEKPYVECDFGTAWQMIYLGPFYPLKKKDKKLSLVITLLQIAIITIMVIIVPNPANIAVSIIMILLINLLFAFNYNMIVIETLLKNGYVPMDYNSSDKLIKKGIYFKLQ